MLVSLLLACTTTQIVLDDTGVPVADTDVADTVDTDWPDTGTRDTDTDDDDDEETDPDDTGWADTGYGTLYSIGGFTMDGEALSSAYFGYTLWGIPQGRSVCDLYGFMSYAGEAHDGCPECKWTFAMDAVEDSVATGSDCDDFGWYDGVIDGWGDGEWGFTDHYDFDYNGNIYPLDDVVFSFYAGGDYYGWYLAAFNYGGNGSVYATESSVSFYRLASYDYYYYYP